MSNPNLVRIGDRLIEIVDRSSEGVPWIPTTVAAKVLGISHRAFLNRLKLRKIKIHKRRTVKQHSLFLTVEDMQLLVLDADASALRDARYKQRPTFIALVDEKYEAEQAKAREEREILLCIKRYTYAELTDLLEITVESDALADGLTRVLAHPERVRTSVIGYITANIRCQWKLVSGQTGIIEAEERLRKALWTAMKPHERMTSRGVAMDATKFRSLILGEYGCTIRCKPIPRDGKGERT